MTLDLDFANPFVFDPRPTGGVIVLRMPHRHGPADLTLAVDALAVRLDLHDPTGQLWVVNERTVRIWQPELDD